MNEPTLDRLTPRLDRLERENRRLKIAGAVVLLALAAMGAMGQVLPKPKVVEAERFVLRDTRGRIRAMLALGQGGAPGLDLIDQNEKTRAVLSLGADGAPGLSLYDQNEKTRAVLSLLPDGAPSLGLADQNEKARAGLSLGADGKPGLALFDQNEKARAMLIVGTSGPSLVLRDENRDRAVLGHTALKGTQTGTVVQRPASSLVLFDKDGKVIWKAP